MQDLSRRNFVKVAGVTTMAAMAAGALSGCSSSESSDKKDDSAKEESKEESFMSEGKGKHLVCAVTGKLIKIAPAILANQLGYFEEEGCDVEFQTVALADAMASMSVNKLDIDLFGIVPACSYVSQGIEIFVFGGTILNGSEIISTKDFTKELKKAEDFKGLNIACSREESGQIYLKNFLQESGLKLGEDVVFEYVDNATTALEGLRSGGRHQAPRRLLRAERRLRRGGDVRHERLPQHHESLAGPAHQGDREVLQGYAEHRRDREERLRHGGLRNLCRVQEGA